MTEKTAVTNNKPEDSHAVPSVKVRSALRASLFWLCTSVGVVALVVVLPMFGWSLWMAILIALLLACPAIVAWVLIVLRHPRVTISRNMR